MSNKRRVAEVETDPQDPPARKRPRKAANPTRIQVESPEEPPIHLYYKREEDGSYIIDPTPILLEVRRMVDRKQFISLYAWLYEKKDEMDQIPTYDEIKDTPAFAFERVLEDSSPNEKVNEQNTPSKDDNHEDLDVTRCNRRPASTRLTEKRKREKTVLTCWREAFIKSGMIYMDV